MASKTNIQRIRVLIQFYFAIEAVPLMFQRNRFQFSSIYINEAKDHLKTVSILAEGQFTEAPSPSRIPEELMASILSVSARPRNAPQSPRLELVDLPPIRSWNGKSSRSVTIARKKHHQRVFLRVDPL